MKKLAAPRQHLTRAVEILEPSGFDAVILANARFDLARALRASGGDEERARGLAEQALRALEEAGKKERAAAVEAWSRAHPR
jgi:hypothetical protein